MVYIFCVLHLQCHIISPCICIIATAYGLEGPGIESRWGEMFRTSPDRPWGRPSLLYNGCLVFPGGKVLPGQRSKIEWSCTSTLPKGLWPVKG